MATLSAVGRARLGRHLMESIAGNDKAELVSDPSISHSLCVQRYEGICANSAAKGVIKNITCLLMSLSCESELRIYPVSFTPTSTQMHLQTPLILFPRHWELRKSTDPVLMDQEMSSAKTD